MLAMEASGIAILLLAESLSSTQVYACSWLLLLVSVGGVALAPRSVSAHRVRGLSGCALRRPPAPTRVRARCGRGARLSGA